MFREVTPGPLDQCDLDAAYSNKSLIIDAAFTGSILDLNISSTYTGTITLDHGLAVTGMFMLGSGTITGPGTLSLTGTEMSPASGFWTGGTMNGPGQLVVAPGSDLSIGGGALSDTGRDIVNAGTIFASGTLTAANCTLTNGYGATFQAMTGFNWLDPSLSTAFVNAGTFRAEGSGSFEGSQFSSTGTIDIAGGTWWAATHLVQNDGQISGGGTLELGGSGVYDHLNGGMQGTGTLKVDAGATMNWSGASDFIDTGLAFDNFGETNWTAGNFVGTSVTFTNKAAGTFNAQGDLTWFDVPGPGMPGMGGMLGMGQGNPSAFNNAGTVNVLGAGTLADMKVFFTTTATVNAQGGVMQLWNGGVLGGVINIAGNASVELDDGIFEAQACAQVMGDGPLIIGGAGGLPGLDVPAAMPAPRVDLRAGGAITGAGTLTVTNVLNWSGGDMAGNGITRIAAGGSMIITDDVTSTDRRIEIADGATGTLQAGALSLLGSTLSNAGFLTLGTGVAIDDGEAVTPGVLVNTGTLKKIGGGTTPVDVPVISSGTVQVESTGLRFLQGGTLSGQFTVQPGTTLTFGINNRRVLASFIGATSFSGTGQVSLSGPNVSMVLAAGLSIRVPNFLFTRGGTIFSVPFDAFGQFVGYGTISAGIFQWDMGTIRDTSVSVQPGDRMQMGLQGMCTLDNSPLRNQGEIQWVGIAITLTNGPSIINDGSGNEGRFLIQRGGTLVAGAPRPGMPVSSFQIISGGLVEQRGTDETTLRIILLNTNGTLDLKAHSMVLQDDYQVSNGQTTIGPGGAFNLTGSFAQSGAGAVTNLGGGGLSASTINILGGQLSLGGGFVTGPVVAIGTGATLSGSGAINGNLMNYGTVALGAGGLPGALTVNGSYTQDAAGNLQVLVGGASAGQFSQLNASGGVTLNGTAVFSWQLSLK